MLPQLKTYIENNIEYLDQKHYYFFILNAISEDLSDAEIRDLINILYDIEDEQALIDKAREDVLRFYITMKIEDYADDEDAPSSYGIAQFIFRYLHAYLGYTSAEIMDFILENKSEWVDNMIKKNDRWRICK